MNRILADSKGNESGTQLLVGIHFKFQNQKGFTLRCQHLNYLLCIFPKNSIKIYRALCSVGGVRGCILLVGCSVGRGWEQGCEVSLSMIHDIFLFKYELSPIRFFCQNCTKNTHSLSYLLAPLALKSLCSAATLLINAAALISNNVIAFIYRIRGDELMAFSQAVDPEWLICCHYILKM